MRGARSEIHRSADRLRAFREHQEAPNCVRHVEQVTSRLEGAKPHRLRVAQSLGHNCGDDRPLRLPGTESVKRSHHAHRCLERAMVTQCQLIGADFCRRIGRLRYGRVNFVNRRILGGPICLAGGRDHQTFHPLCLRRFQKIERAPNIRLDVGSGSDVRVRDPDQSRQVKDGLRSAHQGAHGVRVADIAGYDLNRVKRPPVDMTQGADGAFRIVVHQGTHPRPFRHERLDQMTANESAGACDDHNACVGAHCASA